jgi:hypothetical protein
MITKNRTGQTMSSNHSDSFTNAKQQQAAGFLHDLWTRKDRCAALPDDQRPVMDFYTLQSATTIMVLARKAQPNCAAKYCA